MENIVYILGAGFSRPLGLPLMSDFYEKSMDLYRTTPDHYSHFKTLFDWRDTLVKAERYYETDPFNIEEVLSFLEVNGFLEGKKGNEIFVRYIKDVIEYYTPRIEPYPGRVPSNWKDFVFGKDRKEMKFKWNPFGFFVGSLLGLSFREEMKNVEGLNTRVLHCDFQKTSAPHYSVITFNYDCVLEIICDFINSNYVTKSPVKFSETVDSTTNSNSIPLLAKLHGTIKTGNIIPPTWSKNLHKEIVPVWQSAYDVLIKANQIRFIGYSLPATDYYSRYLFISAAAKAPHLKSIDFLCLDPTETVKANFEEIVRYKNRRFKNARVEEYLEAHRDAYNLNVTQGEQFLVLDKLEEVHEQFFSEST